jgi:hypothetical protein
LTYTIVLDNVGFEDAAAVRLTDTMPMSTTYVPDSLDYAPGMGVGGYNSGLEAITWTGAVSVGLPVTITFQVTVAPAAGHGEVITNTAIISDGAGRGFERTATATVSAQDPPFIESTEPVDGASGVPITSSLVITFSQAMNTNSLSYDVMPDPGNWSVTWGNSNTMLILTPSVWDYAQVYTVSINAENEVGQALVPGLVPNPWSFTTIGPPPHVVSTDPADSASGVPLTASLVITFSEPMITSTLAYTIAPDPGGWAEAWSDGDTVLTLDHAGLAYSQTYTVTVAARDLDNQVLVSGPVPNPWSFTTANKSNFYIYLPLVLRGQ